MNNYSEIQLLGVMVLFCFWVFLDVIFLPTKFWVRPREYVLVKIML